MRSLNLMRPAGVDPFIKPENTTIERKFKHGNKESRVVSRFDGRNLDVDAVRRHERGLRRAGFKGNKDVIGVRGF